MFVLTTMLVSGSAVVTLPGKSLAQATLQQQLVGTWLLTTFIVVTNGGIRSPAQVLYIALPISAAWLVGFNGALFCAVVCLASSLTMAILEFVGMRLRVYIPGTPLGLWVTPLLATVLATVPTAQVLKILKEALEAAENLDKKGVRLWLIAAGPNPDLSALVKQKPETKDLLARSIRSSLQAHGNDPNALLDRVERLVLEEMFPRLGVEVADAGPGLPREAEAGIFETFDAGRRGAGLGLAICHAIVTAHGGRISAHNHFGGGARLRFWLPLESASLPPLAAEG